MAFSRRDFLLKVGQAGGYSAAFTIMQSLGLLPMAEAAVEPVIPVNGKGAKVVILGGGIAGLASAYELGKLGYKCTLLEARDRVGGRNWTIRNGSEVRFTDGTKQTCTFDEGNYFNAGPARLPSIHKTMLGYCHEFGVPLEVEVNTSRSAMMQADHLASGNAVEQRQVVNDTRGHVSELLAKCVKKGALDEDLTADDKTQMLEFLRKYGDLSPDLFYKGSERAGYKVSPGAGNQSPVPHEPLDMRALLDANLWEGLLAEDIIDWQATMFQPVGGMDAIPKAFEKRLGDVIRHRAEILQIRNTANGVTVVYRDIPTRKMETVEAAYCICALPMTILSGLDTNFSPETKQLLAATVYDSAYKVAWEGPRFWEREYNIYGGLSYLQQTVGIVWYPTAGMFSSRGVVISGYSIENGTAFGKLPNMQAKLDASRRSVELLHPGYAQQLGKPVYVSWGQIPYNLGSWISGAGRREETSYQRMLRPEGRIYFAGDHTSHLVGWQEGAALSAHRAVNMIGIDTSKGGTVAA